MKEIVERLHENHQIELAKTILESKGYKVSKKSKEKFKKLKESDSDESAYYLLSIDAVTNAPGTKYYGGGEREAKGEEILKSAGISDPNIESIILGYDDISFSVKSDDRAYVNKIAKKISAYSEEPSHDIQMDWDLPKGARVSISGPYYDGEEFAQVDDRVEFWSC